MELVYKYFFQFRGFEEVFGSVGGFAGTVASRGFSLSSRINVASGVLFNFLNLK